MKTLRASALKPAQKRLIRAAQKAAASAYAPYSGFSVGAALLCDDGTVITGSNVENAAYGSSICAERAALLHANAIGARQFKALAVASKGKGPQAGEIAAPCGACRQMLYEFIDTGDIEVILVSSNGRDAVVTSVRELLPLGFGPRR